VVPNGSGDRNLSGAALSVAINGDYISWDRFGCRASATFIGELSADDIRTRFLILGWQTSEVKGREAHRCPRHSTIEAP
jgi:hypothetical protein